MIPDLLYHAMVAALFTHELDAVKRHEWRILPFTRGLSERLGEAVFIWSHVPLFFAVLWFGQGGAADGVRFGLSAFAVLHVGLHWLLRNHPANEFDDPGSWALILLTGALAAAHLIAALA